MSFEVVIKNATAHGLVVGVSLPGSGEPVPEAVLHELHPDEARFARTLRGFRQEQFAGGRLALRTACVGLGRQPGPVLPDARGAPCFSGGVSGSITHKRHLALALVAREATGSLGVDFEDLGPPREGIAQRVLRPEELAEVESLPAGRHWTATLTRFAIKEAIYKALAPRLQRYIAFEEAAVEPSPDGLARVVLHLADGPEPDEVQARYVFTERGILATVRARWPHPSPEPVSTDSSPQ